MPDRYTDHRRFAITVYDSHYPADDNEHDDHHDLHDGPTFDDLDDADRDDQHDQHDDVLDDQHPVDNQVNDDPAYRAAIEHEQHLLDATSRALHGHDDRTLHPGAGTRYDRD